MSRAILGLVIATPLACAWCLAQEQPNLLVNPGFEVDEDADGCPDAWEHGRVGEGTFALDRAEKFEGEQSLRLEGTKAGVDRSDMDQIVPVTGGRRYRLSVAYRVGDYEATDHPAPFIIVSFRDAEGKPVGRGKLIHGRRQTDGWQRLSGTVDAPSQAVAIVFGFHACRFKGVAWVDDCSVVDAGPVDPNLLALDDKGWERREYTVRDPARPHLYFTAERLAEMRAMRDHEEPNALGIIGREVYEAVVSQAEEYAEEDSFEVGYHGGVKVKYEVPPRQPQGKREPPPGAFRSYPYWTSMAIVIRSRMETLSIAAALTEDPALISAARDYALALADWEVWSDPHYGNGKCNLDTAYLSVGTAAVYDILYDHLSPEERAKIRKALVEKGLRPLHEDALGERAREAIQATSSSALGVASLALLGEEPQVVDFINTAVANCCWNFASRLHTHRTEGLGYYVNIDYAMRLGDILERVTGDDAILRRPYIEQALVPWVLYFVTPDGKRAANFCDSHGRAVFFNTMSVLNSRGNGYAGWYLQHTGLRGNALENVIYYDPAPKITPPDNWPLGLLLPQIGWVAMRSDWEHDGTMFALKSGRYYPSHQHRDQSTFMINVAGDYLAADPGYRDQSSRQAWEFTSSTAGHNGILVDGKGQLYGDGSIEGFFTSPPFDYVRAEAGDVYPELSRVTRAVAYVRPGCFVVFDQLVALDGRPKFEWLLHGEVRRTRIVSGGNTLAPGDPVTPGDLRIESERGALEVRPLLPADAQVLMKGEEGLETYSPWISVPQTGETARYLTLLIAHPTSRDPAPEVASEVIEQEGTVGARLTHGGLSDLILFAADEGRIKTLDLDVEGACCLLRRDADGQLSELTVVQATDANLRGSLGKADIPVRERAALRALSPRSFSLWLRRSPNGVCEGIIEAEDTCRLLPGVGAELLVDGNPAPVKTGTELDRDPFAIPAGRHELSGKAWW